MPPISDSKAFFITAVYCSVFFNLQGRLVDNINWFLRVLFPLWFNAWVPASILTMYMLSQAIQPQLGQFLLDWSSWQLRQLSHHWFSVLRKKQTWRIKQLLKNFFSPFPSLSMSQTSLLPPSWFLLALFLLPAVLHHPNSFGAATGDAGRV